MSNTAIQIVPATAADADAVVRIRQQAVEAERENNFYPQATIDGWLKFGGVEGFADFLAAPGRCFLLAMAGKDIAGFCSARYSQIQATYVAPTFQGQGVGKALLSTVEANAVKQSVAWLFLHASLNSVPFYRHAGFVEHGQVRRSFSHGAQIECVRMDKMLI